MGLFRSSLRQEDERQYKDRELFKRFIERIAPYRKNILLIALFIIVQAIAAIIAPLLVGFVADELILSNPRYVLTIIASVGFLLLYLLNWGAFSMQQVQSGKYVPFFLEDLRLELFTKLQEQDMTFFDKHMSGKLNSIVVNDTLDFSNTAVLISNTVGSLGIGLGTLGILL